MATLQLVAINAVMAGCTPAHFPVVIAALEAALAPEHNLYGVTCTTHMCVPLIIVNGPQRQKLSFNSTDGVFGNGNRSNGTVGRALRLVCWNLGGARPGAQDRSVLSHPGEWTFCIAEDEEGSPWEPFHVERGLAAGDDVVTVFACEPPHSVTAARRAALDPRTGGQSDERPRQQQLGISVRARRAVIGHVNAAQAEFFRPAVGPSSRSRHGYGRTPPARCAIDFRGETEFSEEANARDGFSGAGRDMVGLVQSRRAPDHHPFARRHPLAGDRRAGMVCLRATGLGDGRRPRRQPDGRNMANSIGKEEYVSGDRPGGIAYESVPARSGRAKGFNFRSAGGGDQAHRPIRVMGLLNNDLDPGLARGLAGQLEALLPDAKLLRWIKVNNGAPEAPSLVGRDRRRGG